MSGSFGSINTALTALRYQQVALDVASTNVANVGTDGYVRRRVVGETLGTTGTPGLWSRSAETAGGVRASGIDRMTDLALDVRVRREHGRQTYLDTKAAALARVETGLAEPGDSGIAAALADFRGALHDLGNAPASDAARSQAFLAAQTVADAFRLQANHLADESSDQRAHLLAAVDEVNVVAGQLAATNRSIFTARAGGSEVPTLLDERDALALRLAELTGATAQVKDDGTMEVTLNGEPLVSTFSAARLQVTDGSASGGPIVFRLDPDAAGGSTPLAGPLGGDLGATTELLVDVLPGYAVGLAEVAQDLADAFNAQNALGYDAAGQPATTPFFTYDPVSGLAVTGTAADLGVSAVEDNGNDGNNAGRLVDAVATADDPYQRLVNGFGSTVASVQRLAKNQQALTDQVDNAREQLAGVSLDEETVNMLSAQRAYEAAARVMTTIDSVLDTLINRTGLVR